MKKLILLTLVAGSLFFGCKKNDSNGGPTPTLGSIVKIETSSTGTYFVTLTEYSSDGSVAFSKDTTITNSSFNYAWQPTLNDQVSFIVAYGGSNPTPKYDCYYGNTLETNFQYSTAGSTPFNDYYSLSFTAN